VRGSSRDRPRLEDPAPKGRVRSPERTRLSAELAETGRLLRRGRKRLSPHAVAEVEALRAEARAALAAGDEARIAAARAHLAAAFERHLRPFRKSLGREALEIIGPAVLLAAFLRLFLLEAFQIPSGSMAPTLLPGDQVLVSKIAYGLRLPFGGPVLVEGPAPRRGDVIVFREPGDEGRLLVKRVAAVAGDEVEVRGETVWLNGEEQPRVLVEEGHEFWNRDPDLGYWRRESGRRYLEELDGRRHETLQGSPLAARGETAGPYRVPEGHVFVLGDNRDNSEDGRAGGGWYVPLANVGGKVLLTWFSWGRGGGAWPGDDGVRWGRIGLPVDGAATGEGSLAEAAAALRGEPAGGAGDDAVAGER
jgi:signal peptidase I